MKVTKNNHPMTNPNILIYQTEEGNIKLDVQIKDETVFVFFEKYIDCRARTCMWCEALFHVDQ